MSVIAFIPARGGSKSIPGKNIKDFCGKPLIYWNLFALEKSELVDEIISEAEEPDVSDMGIDGDMDSSGSFSEPEEA